MNGTVSQHVVRRPLPAGRVIFACREMLDVARDRGLVEVITWLEQTIEKGYQVLDTKRREHLLGPGHQLLNTRLGPLDLHGTIEDGLTYEDLQPGAGHMHVDDPEFLVLPLKDYVDLKARSTLEKDRARLPVLRETLKQQNNSD